VHGSAVLKGIVPLGVQPQAVPKPQAVVETPHSVVQEPSDPRSLEDYLRRLTERMPVFQRYYHKKTTTGLRFVLPEGFPPPETAWVREGWVEVRGQKELSLNLTSKGLEAMEKGFVVALVRWCRVREWARRQGVDGEVVWMDGETAETVLREYARRLPTEEGKVRVAVRLETFVSPPVGGVTFLSPQSGEALGDGA
jgi:type IV secretion system protein VirD4